MATYFPVPRAQFHDGDAVLAGGRVTWYEAGTSTPKDIYTDFTETTPATNPQTLDQDGYVREGGVFLGEGRYKIVVERPVSPIVAGEQPEFIVVSGTGVVDGTYSHVSEQPDGTFVYQCQEIGLDNYHIWQQLNGSVLTFGLFNTAPPQAFGMGTFATRVSSLGIFGAWSYPGMQVSYPAYEVYWTMDNIEGAPIADPSESAKFIDTISELRSLSAGASNLVYIAGYYNRADGGEGWFRWDSASFIPDNSGTVIAPSGSPATGRWIRLIEGEYITPNIFGSIPNSTLPVSSNWQSMVNWCNNDAAQVTSKVIRIPRGLYKLGGNVTFTGDNLYVIWEEGAKAISPDVSCTLTFSNRSVVVNGKKPIVDPNKVTLAYAPTDMTCFYRPEWFGGNGSGEGGVDDWAAFKAIPSNTIGGRQVRMGGLYLLDGALDTVTLDNVFFEVGCKLSPTPSSEIVINSYQTESPDMNNVFSGSSIAFKLMPDTFKVRLMETSENDGTYNENDLVYIVTMATADGSHKAELIWDAPGVYTTLEDFSISSTPFLEDTVWTIVSGTTLKYDSNIYLPALNAGTACLDTSSSGVITIGHDIDPKWWGAIGIITTSTIASRNVLALERALESAIASYPSALRGGQANYAIDEHVDFTDVGAKNNVKIRGLSLNPIGSFGANYALSGTITGMFDSDGLTIVTASPSLFLSSDVNSVVISNARLSGVCDYEGVGTFDSYQSMYDGVVTANSCAVAMVSGNTFNAGASFLGTLGIIANNNIDNANLTIVDPKSITINGNLLRATGFYSKIVLSGASAGWVVDGMVCTDNVWYNGMGIYTGISLVNMASDGHVCVVKDNHGNGNITLPSTVVRGEVAWVTGGTVADADINLTIANYILPYTTYPVHVLLTAKRGVNIDSNAAGKVCWRAVTQGAIGTVNARSLPSLTLMPFIIAGTTGADDEHYATYEVWVSDVNL